MRKQFIVLALFFLMGLTKAVASGATAVYVAEVQIVFLETFPLQATAIIKGDLANPCIKIERFQQKRDGNIFRIRFVTQESAQACIQVLKPFEQNVPLNISGLSAGRYQVDVHGVVAEFELKADNK